MVVSVEKLQELASKGVGSKKSFIDYRVGNALSVFSRHEKTPFNMLIADTGPHFIPMLDIQKSVWETFPQLNGMSGERGTFQPLKVVNEIKVTAKKDSPKKYSREFERHGYLGVLIFHRNEVAQDPEYTSFEAFGDSLAGLVKYCNRNKISRVGMNIIGTAEKWEQYSKVIDDVCYQHDFRGKILVYRPKKARK